MHDTAVTLENEVPALLAPTRATHEGKNARRTVGEPHRSLDADPAQAQGRVRASQGRVRASQRARRARDEVQLDDSRQQHRATNCMIGEE